MPITALRPANASDADFAFRVEEDSMRAYAEQTWGTWIPAHDKSAYLLDFEPQEHQIIQVEGEDVGLLSVQVRDDHVLLAQLYLLGSHRNRGIGAEVLGEVIATARKTGLPVKLRTLAVNVRAQAFYSRHGFTVESQDKERVHFVRSDA